MLGVLYLFDQWLDTIVLNLDELLEGFFSTLLLLLKLRLILIFGLIRVLFEHLYLGVRFKDLLHHVLRVDTILIRLNVPLYD